MTITIEEEKGVVHGKGDYTEDGTVDLKGRPVLRSKTGRWKACYFLVVYEVFERMAYYGIATNLVLYLTNKLHEGTVEASNNVTNWIGTVWMMPLLGAYIADAHLGRYRTFVISSVIYFVGMCLLTLAVSVPALRPPSCGPGVKSEDCNKPASRFQVGFFYCALYVIALGTGGTKPNISTMGADQFDDYDPKERSQKLSFFNWWTFSIFLGTLFSNTFVIYIQDNVGWAVGYSLPTVGLATSIIVFIVGTPYYRHKVSSGSPLTRMAKVLVAAVRKWRVVVPSDPKELYELSLEEYSALGKFRIAHTTSMGLLDKAAVKSGPTSPWILCPVTQVEQTKQMLRMIPIFVATVMPSTIFAQTTTLFIKQGTTLNRSMGPHFELPPACLSVFITIFMLISLVLYDCYFVPAIRKYTKNPRGITILQRLGIGLALHIIIMTIACLAERERLSFARAHNITGIHQVIPLTVFILLPQFVLMGVADNFVVASIMEIFYDQVPEGMKSLGTAYFTTGIGIGFFLSSFILSTVSDVTKRNGRKGWILNNLNQSHLDYYYALLAILSFINFIYFLIVAKYFVYNADVDPKTTIELQDKSIDETSKAMRESSNDES